MLFHYNRLHLYFSAKLPYGSTFSSSREKGHWIGGSETELREVQDSFRFSIMIDFDHRGHCYWQRRDIRQMGEQTSIKIFQLVSARTPQYEGEISRVTTEKSTTRRDLAVGAKSKKFPVNFDAYISRFFSPDGLGPSLSRRRSEFDPFQQFCSAARNLTCFVGYGPRTCAK